MCETFAIVFSTQIMRKTPSPSQCRCPLPPSPREALTSRRLDVRKNVERRPIPSHPLPLLIRVLRLWCPRHLSAANRVSRQCKAHLKAPVPAASLNCDELGIRARLRCHFRQAQQIYRKTTRLRESPLQRRLLLQWCRFSWPVKKEKGITLIICSEQTASPRRPFHTRRKKAFRFRNVCRVLSLSRARRRA